MDDNEDKEEVDNSQNHYAILNISKEANDEEIKKAYRAKCVMFHPDKHMDPKQKETADLIFSRVHKAYEVLSDSQTRMIYDIYGQKGLDAGWEMVERKRTKAEIHQEYERLKREAEDRRVEQKTNPKGEVALQIDATNLFSDGDGYEEYGSSSWIPEMRGMSISQSIETPLTRSKTAILSGRLQHGRDNESGMVNCTLRNVFSHQSWGEIEFGTGTGGGEFSLKGFRNLDKKRYATVTLTSALKQMHLSAGLQGMVASQLTKNTMGYLSGTYNLAGMLGARKSPSTVSTTITTNTDQYNFFAQLQLGIVQSHGMVSYTRKLNDDTKLKGVIKYGANGLVFEYSCEHQVTTLSNVGGTISTGPLSGVMLRLKVHRHSQRFDFPIFLSDSFSPSALFYGTVLPVVVFFALKKLIFLPMLTGQKEKDAEESREKHAQLMAERKREAESAISLMLTTYEQSVEQESKKHGLVIREAWYGKFVSKSRQTDRSTPYVINVTIPLQCLVKDSKLILGDQPKSQLTGIYDPCIGEVKSLKIIYEFRDIVHEHVFKDEEVVGCPKQSHRISTKVS